MYSINKPAINADSMYRSCCSTIKKEKRTKFERASDFDFVRQENDHYNRKASSSELYLLPRIDTDSAISFGWNTVEDMKWLYTSKLLKSKEPRKKYYDEIQKLANLKQCPICGIGTVDTLDHVLSKRYYSRYSISPLNLVPCCLRCNKEKNDKPFFTKSDQFLHPYYDSYLIDDLQWLSAEIKPGDDFPGVVFEAKPPLVLKKELRDRIIFHFKNFKLSEILPTAASSELRSLSLRLARLSITLARVEIAYMVEDELSIQKNGWKSALYLSILNSEWFFDIYLPMIKLGMVTNR